jgi:hypothetical protein
MTISQTSESRHADYSICSQRLQKSTQAEKERGKNAADACGIQVIEQIALLTESRAPGLLHEDIHHLVPDFAFLKILMQSAPDFRYFFRLDFLGKV